jgi:hypothetical protein
MLSIEAAVEQARARAEINAQVDQGIRELIEMAQVVGCASDMTNAEKSEELERLVRRALWLDRQREGTA